MPNFFPECEAKMRQAGVPEPTVRAFQNSYEDLNGGKSASMLIRETRIQPVLDLPRLDALRGSETGRALLAKTAVLKLNGGLGTGMGLDGPKSLLRIKDELTFLDMIAKQILHQRNVLAAPVRLLLMNSFTTSEETGRFLSKYPELGPASEMEIMQEIGRAHV